MKFGNPTDLVLGADRAKKLASAIRRLPESCRLGEITSLLRV
jgi:hypothetical protein